MFIGEWCVRRCEETAINTPKRSRWYLVNEHQGTCTQAGILTQIVHGQPFKPSTVYNIVLGGEVVLQNDINLALTKIKQR